MACEQTSPFRFMKLDPAHLHAVSTMAERISSGETKPNSLWKKPLEYWLGDTFVNFLIENRNYVETAAVEGLKELVSHDTKTFGTKEAVIKNMPSDIRQACAEAYTHFGWRLAKTIMEEPDTQIALQVLHAMENGIKIPQDELAHTCDILEPFNAFSQVFQGRNFQPHVTTDVVDILADFNTEKLPTTPQERKAVLTSSGRLILGLNALYTKADRHYRQEVCGEASHDIAD